MSVVITTVVVVAAVPTLIVAIDGNTITITQGTVASSSRHSDDEKKQRIIIQVKSAGDQVIVKLNNEESSCDSQVAQLAPKSKLSATATASELQKGKDQFHASVAPFINEVNADQDELERLSVINEETERTFLARINEVQLIALGQAGQAGVLMTVCQTILIQIERVVVIVQVQPGGGDSERDSRTAS